MKKLLFVVALICSLIGCNSSRNHIVKDSGVYYYKANESDGEDNKQDVKFLVAGNVIDSLKISEDIIGQEIHSAILDAKTSLKFPRTFKFKVGGSTALAGTSGTVLYSQASDNKKSPCITIGIDFIGKNAFGVESDGTNFSKFDLAGKELKQDENTDSAKGETKKGALDTAGLYKAPVLVTKANLFKEEYSDYSSIRVNYKNISKQTIVGIRFHWYGLDAFNEPADMGRYDGSGMGGGFADDALKSGKLTSGVWDILSKNGKKVVLAWPYEVMFKDGTKWELGK